MQTVLNHVALLVPSVQKASAFLTPLGFMINAAAEWEGEGTLEIYVGDLKNQMANLLLMEPVKEGAYTRAMKKRGPGLHHLAIDVLDVEEIRLSQISARDLLLFQALGLQQISRHPQDKIEFILAGKPINFSSLI